MRVDALTGTRRGPIHTRPYRPGWYRSILNGRNRLNHDDGEAVMLLDIIRSVVRSEWNMDSEMLALLLVEKITLVGRIKFLDQKGTETPIRRRLAARCTDLRRIEANQAIALRPHVDRIAVNHRYGVHVDGLRSDAER